MILILGASGYIGNHLFNGLQSNENFELVGTYLKRASQNFIHFDLALSSPEKLLDKYEINNLRFRFPALM